MTALIACLAAMPAAAQQSALVFSGSGQNVTMGRALYLDATNFTVETWFMRTGTGSTTSTGGGGSSVLGLTNVVPLVAKGRGQADGGRVDCNYFLGIQNSPSVVLAGDYEHDAPNNNNHAILGTTVLQNNVWYHAALTYDGATIRLYLNGNLEAQAAATPAPRADLVQYASVATAIDGNNSAAGGFAGVIDEPRIWNVARTQAQIQAGMTTELTSGTGLIGRWGFNEGTGTIAGNSARPDSSATLVGAPTWTTATVFAAPAAPGSLTATVLSGTQVQLSWTDNSTNETSFELERSTTGAGGPYSPLTTYGQGVTSATDNTVVAGNTYCYRMRAANPGGPSAYATAACADVLVPADPSGLVATAISTTRIDLAWADNATGETACEVERSTTGTGGPFTNVATLAAGSTNWSNTGLTAGAEYCYRVRAVNLVGGSGWAGPACGTTPASGALDLGGASAFAAFGNPVVLNLSAFTLEMWVRRDATGTGTGTGSGGIADAVPLLAKGRAENDTQAADVNYLFGIQASTGVLCADLEEAQGGASPGLNHPVLGATVVPVGTWHHVAATYDGTTWRLYLDGLQDAALVVGRPANNANGVNVSLGTALNTGGVAAGFFNGAVDEVRIWNVARTAAEIVATVNAQITTPTTGLVARWAMDEGTGTAVNASAGTSVNGTITGSGYAWGFPAPYDVVVTPPAAPSALVASAAAPTRVSLAWTDNSATESGFEIERSATGSGGPFSALATVGASTTAYDDDSVAPEAAYCYRVRAVNAGGASGWATAACATTPAVPNLCLDLDGVSAAHNAYVNLGNLASLRVSTFTIEAWIRRDGAGVGNTTGAGGIDSAVPILAKGIAEAETPNADINWFLGIQASTGFLVGDFEEGQTGASPSLNHPVYGNTAIPADSTWHHVAATYDGTTFDLYLDGMRTGQLAVGQPVAAVGISPASIGSALKSDGSPLGFFNGRIDEARVWNVARSEAEIQSTINTPLVSAPAGLVARWAMNEGTGTAVGESVGGVGGSVVGSYYSWQTGAPFDWTPPTAPAAPSGVTATACSQAHVDVGWTDNSDGETGFAIERAAVAAGPFTAVGTAAANATVWSDRTVSPSVEYCYRVRAVSGGGNSAWAGPACVTTPAAGANALDLGGTDAYASFGDPAALNLSAFTIEMWMRREGAGTGTNTGSGGIADAVPLFARGRAEVETQAADINYFFGVQQSTGLLCADFEEGQGGASPSLNHPILGATPLAIGTWYHVAVTYDGTSWKLYVNGALDGAADVGEPVNAAGTASATLGSAVTTAGLAAGFFDGSVDEVRVWNYARDQAQIQASANDEIAAAQAGLVARWSMNEGTGTTVGGSAGTALTGTLTGSYGWGCGADAAPLDLQIPMPPLVPTLVGPADGATGTSRSPSLQVAVSDPNGDPVTVTWYGRATDGAPGPDFTLVGFPDTQNYTSQAGSSSNAMFRAQTNWVVANRVARNIAYAVHLGDCSEHGNNGGNPIEWQRADTTLKLLENPATTGLAEGIPFGVCVGNHDQTPFGVSDPDTTTRFYNQYFGSSRFAGRGYYGGHYGTNGDSWFDLFSASGMDFIVIGIEYQATPDPAVLAWADQLLTTYATRRAIVASHFLINSGNPGGFGPQGQAVYNALKAHPNLFLMLCGHVPGEGRRQDTTDGHTVHTLLSDYQSYANGGNGWLRYLEFSPANNVIRVRTYSPWLNQYEADADSSSQFTLPYVMTSTPQFQALGSATVSSGTTASLAWPGRDAGQTYEWYAEVSDGTGTRTSPVWSFTTTAQSTFTIAASAGAGGAIAPSGSVSVPQGASQSFTITPDPGMRVADVVVDGVSRGRVASWDFPDVQADHTIVASFEVIPVDVVAAQVPAGATLSTAHACIAVPVTFTRTNTTGVRAYAVVVRLSPDLALCDTGIEPGSYLSDVAASSFHVVTRTDGSVEVSESILGSTCGATGSGTLFTLHLGSTAASARGTITLDSVRVRDCDNVALPGGAGPVATLPVDNTAPAAPTQFAVQRVTSGNGGGSTLGLAVSWAATAEPGGHVEVWRKAYGNYPEYDDGGAPGAAPSLPAAYPPAGWTLTAVAASGGSDAPPERDAYYYVAYAVDSCGNVARTATMAGGKPDYLLGDVTSGNGACGGDNRAETADISFLGSHYGATLPTGDPAACLDVGPTSTGWVDGRPLTDDIVDFEDLVLFALDYGTVAQAPAAARPAAKAAAAIGTRTSLALVVGDAAQPGATFDAAIMLTGDGSVHALGVALRWDAAVVEPVGVSAGALLEAQSGPAHVFSPRPGSVDAAVFGAGAGFSGSGELARVAFRRVAPGPSRVELGEVRARDAGNRPLALGTRVDPPAPARLELGASYPNPFTRVTTVVFGMPAAANARLVVFDVQGRAVRHLVDGVVGAGWQRVPWDGRDDAGGMVAPGGYVIRLSEGGHSVTRSVRMVR